MIERALICWNSPTGRYERPFLSSQLGITNAKMNERTELCRYIKVTHSTKRSSRILLIPRLSPILKGQEGRKRLLLL